MNLDTLRDQRNQSWRRHPSPREFLAQQDDIPTQSCGAAKRILVANTVYS